MAEYLWTLEALYAAAVANLGPMDQGTHASFTAKAKEEAAKHGIANPKLIIDVKLKEANGLGCQEQPYPIADFEWDDFVRDGKTMAVFMPRVFVVDGDKFTAPI